ncbi:MAG: helix-turn-helix domain-containing protein [Pseudomonadota bacterium]
MAKRLSARGIKKNQTYTLEEAAIILGVHVQTVRTWGKVGLPLMRGQKPHLVHGEDLKTFLTRRSGKAKKLLGPNELYCLGCRRAVRPAGDLADHVASGAGSGRLSGICPHCEGMAQRFVSPSSLREIAPDLLIGAESAVESLTGSANSPSKTHIHDED